MINKPNYWDEVEVFTERRKLPVGAYVCRIKRAVVQDTDYGKKLNILFDIEDGEFAGFFDEMFKADDREDKKWKGVLRLNIPNGDGSDADKTRTRIFKAFVTSIEKSNQAWHWNWDEKTLMNKLTGIVFRNEEWEWNGKTGWSVKPYAATSVSSVEDGTYYKPKDKALRGVNVTPDYGAEQTGTFTELSDDGDELPF